MRLNTAPARRRTSVQAMSRQLQQLADEIEQELSLSRQSLRGFAIYAFVLHSDISHCRKMCSFTALGPTEYEASGTKSLLEQHDIALMNTVVE